MTGLTVIGVDPGRTTGIARLQTGLKPELVQCTPGCVLSIVGALTMNAGWLGPTIIAVEKFVVSTRAGRSRDPQAGEIARMLIGALTLQDDGSPAPPDHRIRVVQRSAAEVKPWATDRRLEAIGALVRGMSHAQDAARHALFAAVHEGALPDPLRKRGTPP